MSSILNLSPNISRRILFPRACKLIDLPGNDFLHTEDYNNVVAAALWTLAVKYDNLPNEERPSDREASRKVGSPPFKDERERYD